MNAHSNHYHTFNFEVAKLLENIAKEHGLHEYKIKTSSGSKKGDGYVGIITAVEMSSDSDKKLLNLIIKSALEGIAIRAELSIPDLYQQEIYMYNTVIPAFQQFLRDKGLPLFTSFAKFYKGTLIYNSEALILENLKTRGFQLWERRMPMNEEHVALVMKEYGRLHGLSFAMIDQNPLKFKELTKGIDDDLFFGKCDFLSVTINNCNKVAEQLFTLGEYSVIAEHLRKFIRRVPQFIKSLSSEYSVILHGDCSTNNLTFKYEDKMNGKNPTHVCFIDLQVSRLGPPVLDAAYFFYACSSKPILDNFQHYLDLYYNSLAEYLKQLGSNPDEVYPYTVFVQQWKSLAKFGLLVSITIIKLMLSEQDEVSDLSEYAETGKAFSDVFGYNISRSNEYNERVKLLVMHFLKNDFL